MNSLTQNILDAIKRIGEDELLSSLSDFSCGVNKDIQNFLQLKAIDFCKEANVHYLSRH